MIRSEQKEKWLVYILAVLLCLVLTSFWLMCNVYARYTAEASGGDSARVAKFDVTEESEILTEQIKTDVYPGFRQTYEVSVTNKSEVAIEYTIKVENKYGNLPLEFRTLDSANQEIQSAEISAEDQDAHTYKLEISWPTETADAKDPAYAGKADVLEITLSAIQKD